MSKFVELRNYNGQYVFINIDKILSVYPTDCNGSCAIRLKGVSDDESDYTYQFPEYADVVDAIKEALNE